MCPSIKNKQAYSEAIQVKTKTLRQCIQYVGMIKKQNPKLVEPFYQPMADAVVDLMIDAPSENIILRKVR